MIPKFRAFYKQEMHNVLVIDWLFNHVDLSGGIIEIPFDEVELMQSTGLTDVNENEIYYDDILKCDDGTLLVVDDERTHSFLDLNLHFGYEIIGNVHEHPHLLEVTE